MLYQNITYHKYYILVVLEIVALISIFIKLSLFFVPSGSLYMSFLNISKEVFNLTINGKQILHSSVKILKDGWHR